MNGKFFIINGIVLLILASFVACGLVLSPVLLLGWGVVFVSGGLIWHCAFYGGRD